MIRVIVVDAERNLHQGVDLRFKTEPDLTVVGKADNLLSALQTVSELRADIVLLDPAGFHHDPSSVVSDVLRADPLTRVVVLSLDDDPDTRERMLTAGASAFVSKHDGGHTLAEVLRRVAASWRGLSRSSA